MKLLAALVLAGLGNVAAQSVTTTFVPTTITTTTATRVYETPDFNFQNGSATVTEYSVTTITTSFASVITSPPNAGNLSPGGMDPTPGANDTVSSTTTTSSTSTSTSTSTSSASLAQATIVPDDSNGQEQGYPDTPEDLLLDEQIAFLTYLANVDKAKCLERAQDFATQTGAYLRKRLAASYQLQRRAEREADDRPWFKRLLSRPPPRPNLGSGVTVPRNCLPVFQYIPVTVHWIVPAGQQWQTWAQPYWSAFRTQQMKLLNEKYKVMNIRFDLQNQWAWQSDFADGRSPGASAFSEHKKYAKANAGYVASTRKRVGTDAVDHLNLYIVDTLFSGQKELGGYCNFPGVSRAGELPDACVIRHDQVLGVTTVGTLIPHEIGHWLNLYHTQENGCNNPGDWVTDTPQYSGKDGEWDVTCAGVKLEETNIMSYSDYTTNSNGFFSLEQSLRAMTGLALRRQGWTRALDTGAKRPTAAVKKFLVDNCYTFDPSKTNNRKRSTSWVDDLANVQPLTKRQAATAFSAFCESTDLTISNYEFSDYSYSGLYNSSAGAAAVPVGDANMDIGEPAGSVQEPQEVTPQQAFAEVQRTIQSSGGGSAFIPPAAQADVVAATGGNPGALGSGSGSSGKSSSASAIGDGGIFTVLIAASCAAFGLILA